MWQAISQQISQQIGTTFTIAEREELSGEINRCYCISDALYNRYFVKINEKIYLPHYQAESEAIRQLAATQTLNVPEFICVGQSKDHAFIVFRFAPMKSLDPESAFHLGKQLAMLHQWGVQVDYGFDDDNYIGKSLQPNPWRSSWATFFAEQRIGWQLQLAKEKGFEFGDIDHITDNVRQRLAHHQPKPSLLHGDLWIGNCALSVDGPIAFDPAPYWGDRECDIAMTELFSGFPPAFMEGYQAEWPLDRGYEERKELYNLYHLLNHLVMFGGDYQAQVLQRLTRLRLI
uniref:fructosamine kinase family protein n=1 Tax=Thaumasiovibrio occultus TaxID=1891184 RepID=UPI000B3537C8|nr:fructosamine kinase family protein [Thaumasiovibrio occultus]